MRTGARTDACRFTFHDRVESARAQPRGTDAPELCERLALSIQGGRREGRMLAAPMAPVRMKCTGQEPQVRTEQPAFPAQWVYGLYVISPVTRLCCHRRRRDAQHHRQLDANLGAPGPHDFTVRRPASRLRV